MRQHVLIVLTGCLSLAACVGDEVGPLAGKSYSRMPVVVDYYDHRTLHPVARHRDGRVDPVDTGPGRHRDFGPEPAIAPPEPAAPPDDPATAPARPASAKPDRGPVSLLEGPRSGHLADMRRWLHALPSDDGAFLALARNQKVKAHVAKAEAHGTPDDVDTPRDGDDVVSADTPGLEDQSGGYRLNFEDAEIKDVLQAVLGRVLGLNYTVAPNVTGRITISSSAPQNRDELLSTLEGVLAMQGLSLTRAGSTYRVAPFALGSGTLDTTGRAPGFGISVVPLRFSSVAAMNKLLNGFVTDGDGVRIDTLRNTVIVRGPGPRRAEVVQAIRTFDGDWMHTQSVSMFELKRSHPDEVIEELTRIFASDKDNGSEGVIDFKPVKRLRSIMVVSKNQALIRRAAVWIRRLDHQETSATSSIFIYRPQYRDARELTKLVNGLFGQGSGALASGVSYQQPGQQPGSGAQGSGGQDSGAGGIGSSLRPSTGGLMSASTTAGLSSGGIAGASAGGSAGGDNGTASRSAFGSLGGFKGELADPIEAGEGRGSGDKLKLSADTSNNTIVAYTDGETYAKVRSVLQQLDLPPLQVAVNVIIAEVQLNDELKYGVQFYLNQSARSVGSVGFSTSATSLVQSAAQGAAAGVGQVLSPSSGFNFISGAASPNVIISALDSISKVHILSTPSIVVMENKAATLEVGNQVPVTTQQAQSNLTPDAPTVNSVTYLDTGIILRIIPRVGQNGVVEMQIDQEISSVVPDATGSTTASLTPTISKRRIASDISVKSGQNVLLAGLVTDTRSRANGQVPFIGPQLGNLLGNTDNSFSRTELVMFLRPVIIRHGQDAAEVAQDFKQGLGAMSLRPPPVYKP